MILEILIIFLLLISFIGLFFIIFSLLGSILRKVPLISSSSETIPIILDKLKNKNNGVFIDLGCGNGKILTAVKRKYPKMEVIGYENWFSQFFLAKLFTFFSGVKVKIFYKDLFSADLEKADFVFCYLFNHFMPKLESKIKKEMKDQSIVIANTFHFKDWQPIFSCYVGEKRPDFEEIFIYKIEK